MHLYEITFRYTLSCGEQSYMGEETIVGGEDAQMAVNEIRDSMLNEKFDPQNDPDVIVSCWNLVSVKRVCEVSRVLLPQVISEAKRLGVTVED